MRASRFAALASLLALAGCEPSGFLPGTGLAGDPRSPKPTDLLRAVNEYGLQIEALDEPWLPAANVRCLVVDDVLYVFSGSIVELGWLRALHRDPSARLRIRDDLYRVNAVALDGADEIDPLLPELLRKYFGVEAERPHWTGRSQRFPDTQMGLNFFRIEPR